MVNNKKDKKISVIVPIYRVEKYLVKCIESIINQTYTNLEIILIDDGSDDSCPDICDEYAKKDERIIVIHQENQGQDVARKTGIQVASGEYVGYVDGDDWIDPQMYEIMLRFAIENDVDIVETGVIDSWDNNQKVRVSIFDEGVYKGHLFSQVIAPKLIYSGKFFTHGISPYLVTKIFRRELITKFQMKFDTSKNIVDDIMCTFPCIISARSIYITHQAFYHYRVRDNSAKREVRDDIAQIVKECYPEWRSRFGEAITSDQIEKQIQYFVMYLLIAKAIYVFDNQNDALFLQPFGGIERSKKIILYGAGTVGIHMHSYIMGNNKESLVGWIDKNYESIISEHNIQAPKEINNMEYDFVIVSILSGDAVSSAKKDLIQLGVPEQKILWIEKQYIEEPWKLLENAKIGHDRIFDEQYG